MGSDDGVLRRKSREKRTRKGFPQGKPAFCLLSIGREFNSCTALEMQCTEEIRCRQKRLLRIYKENLSKENREP